MSWVLQVIDIEAQPTWRKQVRLDYCFGQLASTRPI